MADVSPSNGEVYRTRHPKRLPRHRSMAAITFNAIASYNRYSLMSSASLWLSATLPGIRRVATRLSSRQPLANDPQRITKPERQAMVSKQGNDDHEVSQEDAYAAALEHVKRFSHNGKITEAELRKSLGRHSGDDYWADLGGWKDGKRIPPSKVVVTKVAGKKCMYIFPLHELYKKMQAQPTSDTSDIFLWANTIDAVKNELAIDVFLFTKGYTVYSLPHTTSTNVALRTLCLYDMVSTVQTGAATGMNILPSERYTGEANTVMRESVERVTHAQEVIEQVEFGCLEFNNDIDPKNLKGIVVRFSKPGMDNTYIVKELKQSQLLRAAAGFVVQDSKLHEANYDFSFKLMPDSQVLIYQNTIFAFSLTKFVSLFDYDPVMLQMVRAKGALVDEAYKLKFPDLIQSIDFAIGTNKTLGKKLLDVELGLISQKEALDIIDKHSLGLMVTENDEIILDDKKAIGIFLDLLLDNFVTGGTGIDYVASTKHQLRSGEGE